MFKFVCAGAGTGKTTFIINKIKEILDKNNKNPNNKKILLITYTNSCVEEMTERLKKNNIPLDNIHICTFHGLCNKFINSNKIFMENNSLEIISNYLNIQLPKEFMNFYNYFLSHTPLDQEDYKKKLKDLFPGEKSGKDLENLEYYFRDDGVIRKKPPTSINDKAEWENNLQVVKGHFNYLNYTYNILYVNIFEKIEEARKVLNLYTFHHMILETLDNINEFTMKIWETYEDIFIDEVQDLSHVQFKIIESLATEMVYLNNKNITIVGDIHQSIFSFQGANEMNFNNFLQYIKEIPTLNYEEFILNNTYRFGGKILETINKHFYFHTSHIREGEIQLMGLCRTHVQLINNVIVEINKLIDMYEEANNLQNLNILIIFHRRSNLIYELEKTIEINNKLFIYMDRKIFSEQEVLNNFFNLIEFLISKNNRILCEFLLGGMIVIPEPDFFNFMKGLNGAYENLYDILINKYNFMEEIKILKQLVEAGNLCNLSIGEFLSIFTDSILEKNFYNFYGKDGVLFINNLKKSIEESLGDLLLIDLLELKGEDLWFLQKGNIRFSTIHNAKGGEADYVFIIDGNEGLNKNRLFLVDNFPIYNFFMTEEYYNNSKEFKNLLYVSLTRAKKKLYIIGQGLLVKKNSLYDVLKDLN